MNRLVILGAAAAVLAAPLPAQKLSIVTSTTDLHAIAHAVGDKRISAMSIAAGYQDPHFVEAKPSFALQLGKADVFAYVGLDLEVGWMPTLLDAARNRRINRGGSGDVDVSRVIPVLDVQATADRSMGDVHPRGNPHYWLHPENGKRIARLFRDKFSELDPEGTATYRANTVRFEASIDSTARALAPMLASIRGQPVVAYHTSWRYFQEFTGMNIVGFIEPKPGVPPSPSHLAGLIQQMKRTGVKVIIMEPFYDRKMPDFVARNTGAKVLVLPPSVDGVKGVDSYVKIVDYDVRRLAEALR
ncbi:MAG TPA: metal ABC transporter substrate-binding protein [Gemmatimonadaceae bacterium]|nr:metal ABC transporter substrate-binding protein [Gemmatimonadaceae bacterium]